MSGYITVVQSNKLGLKKENLIRVVAAIIIREGKILLSKRRADKQHGGFWEFPGGKVEPNESDFSALRRELLEELGIDIEINDNIEFYASSDFIAEKISNFKLFFYICRNFSGQALGLEGQEIAWIKISDLEEIEMPPADIEVKQQLIADFAEVN